MSAVALDEADRMADLGFVPPVDRLPRHLPPKAQAPLVSAALDGAVAGLLRQLAVPRCALRS